MSWMRRRHSLGGKNRLVQDAVAELRLEGCRRHEIDGMANEFSQAPLKPDKLEETDRPIELDEQIHIAVRSSFITSEGTEERQTGDTERVQERPTLTEGS
jgi:hypothetical protein